MSKTKKPTGDYEVGYGKPPKHTQFKPTESRKRKRTSSKRKRGAVDVAAILEKPVTVRQNGRTRKMSPFEASMRKLVSSAINDNVFRAMAEFLRQCEKHGVLVPPTPRRARGVLYIPKDWDSEEWLQTLRRRGPPPWPGPRSGLPKNPIE
jgi:hypothetical protein